MGAAVAAINARAAEPLVSVIIPCFNAGLELREALASVAVPPVAVPCEVIIINDGSTNPTTLALLHQLEAEGYLVVHQPNQGPAAARNAGVAVARGQYILLLDSDNKIRPLFFELGVAALHTHPEVGVVHGLAAFFGESTEVRFQPRPFDLYRLLAGNYIDMCTLIRKVAWDELGGLDEARVLIGHEDWEFWLRVGASRWQFYFIEQVLFDYRVGSSSLVTQATQKDKFNQMRQYVYQKHWQLLADAYGVLHQEYLAYRHDKSKPFRSLAKFLYAQLSSHIKG